MNYKLLMQFAYFIKDLDILISAISKSKIKEDTTSTSTDRAIPTWVVKDQKTTLVMYLKSCAFNFIPETLNIFKFKESY